MHVFLEEKKNTFVNNLLVSMYRFILVVYAFFDMCAQFNFILK